MALNRSDKSRILRRYFPGMTRNSEMSTEPSSETIRPGTRRKPGLCFFNINGTGPRSPRGTRQINHCANLALEGHKQVPNLR